MLKPDTLPRWTRYIHSTDAHDMMTASISLLWRAAKDLLVRYMDKECPVWRVEDQQAFHYIWNKMIRVVTMDRPRSSQLRCLDDLCVGWLGLPPRAFHLDNPENPHFMGLIEPLWTFRRRSLVTSSFQVAPADGYLKHLQFEIARANKVEKRYRPAVQRVAHFSVLRSEWESADHNDLEKMKAKFTRLCFGMLDCFTLDAQIRLETAWALPQSIKALLPAIKLSRWDHREAVESAAALSPTEVAAGARFSSAIEQGSLRPRSMIDRAGQHAAPRQPIADNSSRSYRFQLARTTADNNGQAQSNFVARPNLMISTGMQRRLHNVDRPVGRMGNVPDERTRIAVQLDRERWVGLFPPPAVPDSATDIQPTQSAAPAVPARLRGPRSFMSILQHNVTQIALRVRGPLETAAVDAAAATVPPPSPDLGPIDVPVRSPNDLNLEPASHQSRQQIPRQVTISGRLTSADFFKRALVHQRYDAGKREAPTRNFFNQRCLENCFITQHYRYAANQKDRLLTSKYCIAIILSIMHDIVQRAPSAWPKLTRAVMLSCMDVAIADFVNRRSMEVFLDVLHRGGWRHVYRRFVIFDDVDDHPEILGIDRDARVQAVITQFKEWMQRMIEQVPSLSAYEVSDSKFVKAFRQQLEFVSDSFSMANDRHRTIVYSILFHAARQSQGKLNWLDCDPRVGGLVLADLFTRITFVHGNGHAPQNLMRHRDPPVTADMLGCLQDLVVWLRQQATKNPMKRLFGPSGPLTVGRQWMTGLVSVTFSSADGFVMDDLTLDQRLVVTANRNAPRATLVRGTARRSVRLFAPDKLITVQELDTLQDTFFHASPSTIEPVLRNGQSLTDHESDEKASNNLEMANPESESDEDIQEWTMQAVDEVISTSRFNNQGSLSTHLSERHRDDVDDDDWEIEPDQVVNMSDIDDEKKEESS